MLQIQQNSWAQLAHFFISKVVRLEDVRGFSIDEDTDFPELRICTPFTKKLLWVIVIQTLQTMNSFVPIFTTSPYGGIDL